LHRSCHSKTLSVIRAELKTGQIMLFAFRIRWITSVYVLFLLILSAFEPADGMAQSQTRHQHPLENKSVLILNAVESNIPAFQKTELGLSVALQSGGIGIRHQFYEHLDLRHNPGPEHRKLIVELIHRRYDRRKIDLIITIYPEALNFLLEEGQAIFPEVPVLALYLPESFKPPETDRRIIPHMILPDLGRTLEIALKLVPRAGGVYVVGGVHPIDRWFEDRARQDFKKWEGRLEFRYLSGRPLAEILQAVSTAPAASIVYLNSFGTDVTGKALTTVEVGHQLARVTAAPVFGSLGTLLGNGIVGGSLISFENVGIKAGEMAVDILRGSRLEADIPAVMKVAQLNMFDWRQLRRWGLDESALPRGSVIINKEFSLWDLKYYFIGVLVFILVQSLLIIGLLVQKHRRSLAEASLRQKSKELDQFFNVSIDLLCIANTDGRLLRLNPVWESALGYSQKELLTQKYLDFVHPDDVVSTQGAIATLASQQRVVQFENRYRCQDGTYRWLEWSAAPVGNLIFAVARDVTERRRAKLEIDERLRFEHLVSDLLAGFVNLPPQKVDSAINRGLRAITEFFKVDRCTIGLFSQDRTLLVRAFEYVAAGAEPAPESISKEQMPWYLEQLIQGNPVIFSRVADLPPEAEKERQICVLKSMKSVLSVPMVGAGVPIGSCVLVSTSSERVWPEELAKRFQLITEVFVNTLERRKAEEASRASERALRQNEKDLRTLTGRLISAHEDERSRLARELHDDLAQRLAVFAIDVGRLQQQLSDPPATVQQALGELQNDIVAISQDVHNLSRQLHPSILEDLGLIKAVESECTTFSKREGIETVFDHKGMTMDISKPVSLSLYRIFQEALSNVSKHACADHVTVSLKSIGPDVFLSVQDDGIGFDPAEASQKPGLGLSSMRERVRLIHGEFLIRAQAQKGTEIAVKVPLTRSKK